MFDVIVVDFPDPTNFSIGKLYTNSFYALLDKRLAASGYAVVQTTSPLVARKSFWTVVDHASNRSASRRRPTTRTCRASANGASSSPAGGRGACPMRCPRACASCRRPTSAACCSTFRATWRACRPRSTACRTRCWSTTYEQEWGKVRAPMIAAPRLLGAAARRWRWPAARRRRRHRRRLHRHRHRARPRAARRRAGQRHARGHAAHARRHRRRRRRGPGGGARAAPARASRTSCCSNWKTRPAATPRGPARRHRLPARRALPAGAGRRRARGAGPARGTGPAPARGRPLGVRRAPPVPQPAGAPVLQGQWQEGLLPLHGVGEATLAQYRRFAQRVDALRRQAHFAIPMAKVRCTRRPACAGRYRLSQHGWTAKAWTIRTCAGTSTTAAATTTAPAWRRSRPGPASITSPAATASTRPATRRGRARRRADLARGQCLAHPAPGRAAGRAAARPARWSRALPRPAAASRSMRSMWRRSRCVRWQAGRCIVALPVFVAARVVENAPNVLRHAAAQLRYAPWLVANVHLRAPLADRPGAAPSWDNVLYGTRGLGYVDARHQSWTRRRAPRCSPGTGRWAPAASTAKTAGAGCRTGPGPPGATSCSPNSRVPHPDLARLATRIEITRYGHAMAIPTPGLLGQIGPQRPSNGRDALSSGAKPGTRRPPGVRACRLVGLFDLRGSVHARPSGRGAGGVKTLVLGGYGNFGARICRALAGSEGIALLQVGGRDLAKAAALAQAVGGAARGVRIDLQAADFGEHLRALGVDLVIHTAGPFQSQDYRVAQAAAARGRKLRRSGRRPPLRLRLSGRARCRASARPGARPSAAPARYRPCRRRWSIS